MMFIAAMAALTVGFVSCSDHDVYDADAYYQKQATAYKTNFEKQYGKVSSTQSWDFSARNDGAAYDVLEGEQPNVRTRAISSVADVNSSYEISPGVQISILKPVETLNELAYIRTYGNAQPTKEWTVEDMYGVHDMWVWYAHGYEGMEELDNGFASYSLGIHYIEIGTGSYNAGTEYYTHLPIAGAAYTNGWYPGYSNTATGVTDGKVGQRIDASGLADASRFEDVYWWAMVDDGTPDNGIKEKFELKYYKEYTTPRGAVYWLFDCNHDGDYTDLICLVEPTATCKRYMVEDLGATDDFDFNDIVIDVSAKGEKQWAEVRAMGGTLDFTVTIGNTTWTKSENGFNPAMMYNTKKTVDWNAVLATFDVTGWVPESNNITVQVKGSTNNGTAQDRTVSTIAFPKRGEVPMMIAVAPTQTFYCEGKNPGDIGYWMYERVSIPASLFTEE